MDNDFDDNRITNYNTMLELLKTPTTRLQLVERTGWHPSMVDNYMHRLTQRGYIVVHGKHKMDNGKLCNLYKTAHYPYAGTPDNQLEPAEKRRREYMDIIQHKQQEQAKLTRLERKRAKIYVSGNTLSGGRGW